MKNKVGRPKEIEKDTYSVRIEKKINEKVEKYVEDNNVNKSHFFETLARNFFKDQ